MNGRSRGHSNHGSRLEGHGSHNDNRLRSCSSHGSGGLRGYGNY
ncbi:16595_t:CDS:2, partial [Funneliformis mosseae]